MKAVSAKSQGAKKDVDAVQIREKAKMALATANDEDEQLTLEDLTIEQQHGQMMEAIARARRRFRTVDKHDMLTVSPVTKVAFFARNGAFYGTSTGQLTSTCVVAQSPQFKKPGPTTGSQHPIASNDSRHANSRSPPRKPSNPISVPSFTFTNNATADNPQRANTLAVVDSNYRKAMKRNSQSCTSQASSTIANPNAPRPAPIPAIHESFSTTVGDGHDERLGESRFVKAPFGIVERRKSMVHLLNHYAAAIDREEGSNNDEGRKGVANKRLSLSKGGSEGTGSAAGEKQKGKTSATADHHQNTSGTSGEEDASISARPQNDEKKEGDSFRRQQRKPRIGFGFGGRAASAFRLRQRLSVARILEGEPPAPSGAPSVISVPAPAVDPPVAPTAGLLKTKDSFNTFAATTAITKHPSDDQLQRLENQQQQSKILEPTVGGAVVEGIEAPSTPTTVVVGGGGPIKFFSFRKSKAENNAAQSNNSNTNQPLQRRPVFLLDPSETPVDLPPPRRPSLRLSHNNSEPIAAGSDAHNVSPITSPVLREATVAASGNPLGINFVSKKSSPSYQRGVGDDGSSSPSPPLFSDSLKSGDDIPMQLIGRSYSFELPRATLANKPVAAGGSSSAVGAESEVYNPLLPPRRRSETYAGTSAAPVVNVPPSPVTSHQLQTQTLRGVKNTTATAAAPTASHLRTPLDLLTISNPRDADVSCDDSDDTNVADRAGDFSKKTTSNGGIAPRSKKEADVAVSMFDGLIVKSSEVVHSGDDGLKADLNKTMGPSESNRSGKTMPRDSTASALGDQHAASPMPLSSIVSSPIKSTDEASGDSNGGGLLSALFVTKATNNKNSSTTGNLRPLKSLFGSFQEGGGNGTFGPDFGQSVSSQFHDGKHATGGGNNGSASAHNQSSTSQTMLSRNQSNLSGVLTDNDSMAKTSFSSMSKIFKTTSSDNGEGGRKKKRQQQKRSFVQKKLDRARRQKVPLSFVIAEMERRVDEERTLKDFGYYLLFLSMFIIYFVATRNIETNHLFAGYSTQVLTSTLLAQYDVMDNEVVTETTRRDTEAAYGSSPTAIHESFFVTTADTGEEGGSGTTASSNLGIGDKPTKFDPGVTSTGSKRLSTRSSFRSFKTNTMESAANTIRRRIFQSQQQDLNGTTDVVEEEDASSDMDPFEKGQYERVARELNAEHYGFLNVNTVTLLANWLQYAFIPIYWNCANPSYRPPLIARLAGTTSSIGAGRITVKRVRRDSCTFNKKMNDGLKADPDTVARDSGNYTGGTETPFMCYASTGYTGVPDSVLSKEPFCNVPNPMKPDENLFEFRECEASYLRFTASKAVYSCSGHVATMPLSASCDQANSLMRVMRPYIPTTVPGDNVSSSNSSALRNATTSPGGDRSPYSVSTVEADLNQNYTINTIWRRYTNEGDSTQCNSFLFGSGVRLVVVEIYAYDNEADSFLQVRAIAEITAGGAVIPTFTTRIFRVWSINTIPITIFEFFFFALVLVFVKRLIGEWAISIDETGSYLLFLTDIWNLIEAANLTCFLVAIAFRWSWWLSDSYQVKYNLDSSFPSVLRIIEHKYQLNIYAGAINLLLTFLKILKYLRISERLSVLTRTISHAQGALIGVTAILVLVISSFAITAQLMFGSNVAAFANFNTAFSSLLFQMRGQSNFDEMRRMNSLVTYMFILSFWLLSSLLVENFFVVVLSDGFAQVSHQHALPPLSEQVLRKFSQLRLYFTWGNLWERIVKLSEGHDLTRLLQEVNRNLHRHRELHMAALGLHGDKSTQRLAAAAATLADDERISRLDLGGNDDGRGKSKSSAMHSLLSENGAAADGGNIGMYFRDLNWWVPRPTLEALGPYFLLLLWEDIVFAYIHSETCSLEYMHREALHDSIQAGVDSYFDNKLPDFLSLEVQADRLSALLSKVPATLCEDDSDRQQRKKRRAILELSRKKLAEKSKKGRLMGGFVGGRAENLLRNGKQSKRATEGVRVPSTSAFGSRLITSRQGSQLGSSPSPPLSRHASKRRFSTHF